MFSSESFGPQGCFGPVEVGMVLLCCSELCWTSVQLPAEVCGLLWGDPGRQEKS